MRSEDIECLALMAGVAFYALFVFACMIYDAFNAVF